MVEPIRGLKISSSGLFKLNSTDAAVMFGNAKTSSVSLTLLEHWTLINHTRVTKRGIVTSHLKGRVLDEPWSQVSW